MFLRKKTQIYEGVLLLVYNNLTQFSHIIIFDFLNYSRSDSGSRLRINDFSGTRSSRNIWIWPDPDSQPCFNGVQHGTITTVAICTNTFYIRLS